MLTSNFYNFQINALKGVFFSDFTIHVIHVSDFKSLSSCIQIRFFHPVSFCSLLLPVLLPGRRPHVLPQRVVDDGQGREAADGAGPPHGGQRSGQAEALQRGRQQIQRSCAAAENRSVQGERRMDEGERVR